MKKIVLKPSNCSWGKILKKQKPLLHRYLTYSSTWKWQSPSLSGSLYKCLNAMPPEHTLSAVNLRRGPQRLVPCYFPHPCGQRVHQPWTSELHDCLGSRTLGTNVQFTIWVHSFSSTWPHLFRLPGSMREYVGALSSKINFSGETQGMASLNSILVCWIFLRMVTTDADLDWLMRIS